jgi:hypothetical protein
MNRPVNRNSRPSGLAKQSRNKKALFLPLDRAAADELVLPVRIAFERIRQGKVDRDATVCMAEILLLTGFLTAGGFGQLDPAFLDDVEKRLLAELNQGGVPGEWKFAAELVDALVVVVNEYDRLVRETRLQAIVEANQSFARLRRMATN